MLYNLLHIESVCQRLIKKKIYLLMHQWRMTCMKNSSPYPNPLTHGPDPLSLTGRFSLA